VLASGCNVFLAPCHFKNDDKKKEEKMKQLLLFIVFWQLTLETVYASPASIISYAARFAPFIIVAILILAIIVWFIIKKNSGSDDNEAE